MAKVVTICYFLTRVVYFLINLISSKIECSSKKPSFYTMKLESKDFLYDKLAGTLR